MKKRITAMMLCITMSTYGCSTSSKKISASYVSPMQYHAYDCDQLALESQRIQARVNELSGRLDQAATNDKWIMTAGLLLVWPALFALGGTKEQEAEYARLKGEYDAIHQAAVMRKCTGVPATETAAAEEPVIDITPETDQ